MRRIHPMLAALAAVTIALAGCQQQASEEGAADETAAAESMNDQAALEAMTDSYAEAFAAHDWDKVLGFHTSDYQEITPDGGTMSYDEVSAALRDSAQAPPEGGRLTIDAETFEIAASGDVAYGSGTATFSAPGPDGQPMSETTRWVAGFQKVDGEWKVDRLAQVATGGAGATDEGGMDDGTMDEGGMDEEGSDSSM